MFGQISLDVILLFMLYGVGAAVAAGACLYLVLRRANAFAPEVTPPVRLRRWTAAFFAVLAIGHLWYLPAAVLTDEDFTVCMLVSGLLDCVTVIPLVTVLLLCMLQDRQRPLWPVGVMTAPLVVLIVAGIVNRSEAYIPMVYGYLLLLGIGLIAYMVRAVRQYGRWLRENFADLEHKEVWQSFVVLAIMLLAFGIYAFISEGAAYQYVMQVILVVLICYLLWRVETLNELSMPVNDMEEEGQAPPLGASLTLRNDIGPLLKKHCEEPQLYLQHDLNLLQLATETGINRSYLSKHFASQGITYNTYINGLRIQHFVSLYREAVANHQPVTAQEMAYQSGFRSYNTFSVAFKKMMGMTATEWMRLTES